MTPEDCKSAMAENLRDSILAAADLEALLRDERAALERKDTMSLSDTAVDKRICINKLEQLEAKRQSLGKSCGLSAQPKLAEELLAWCDDANELSLSWTRFLEIAQKCSDMNSGNGAIIRVRQSQIKDAICLLRDGNTESETYGPTGHQSGELGTRSLARA